MKKIIISIFILNFIFTALVQAEQSQKLRVGVIEFDEKNNIGIDKAGVIISEIIVTHLKNIGKYQLTERVLLKEILKEQQLQMTGITDDNTAVKIGKINGLEAIVTGSAMKVVSTITISGRVISVQTGEIIASGVIKFQDAEKIESELEGLAYQLSGTSKDDFVRLKTAREIAMSRYGIRVGTGYATSGATDYVDSKYEEITISGWTPLYLSLFYYGEYFDIEFFGFPPPSLTTGVGSIVNINPFTHLGFGFGYFSLKQAESTDEGAPYVEAQSVIAGVNYRATSSLRATLYFGMALSAETKFKDDSGFFYNYETKNYIGDFPPAAMILSIEYLMTENISVMLLFALNGGGEQKLIAGPSDRPPGTVSAPKEVESETSMLVLAVGYGFTL